MTSDLVLDNRSPVPLYHQLKNYLENLIATGDLNPGDRIPSESELGEKFQVSRTTVRQALGDLVNQGVLTRIQGKGTFIAQKRIQQQLGHLTSFTQDMQSRLSKPRSEVLRFEVVSSNIMVANALQIQTGDPVILLKRIRYADDQPLAVEVSYLPYREYGPLLEENFAEASLYETLKKRFNILAVRALQQIEAVSCPNDEARLLKIRRGAPILHINRTTFSQDDRPFETVESYYRSDCYVFHVEIWTK